MPSSIINSDNGVSSGTTGLKTTGGDDGVLKIQTNGTDAISINSSQVVNFANPPTGLGINNGASTNTSSVTLTAASNVVQNFTHTEATAYVTLPDATTMTAGASRFVIVNNGRYPIGIKNNSGIVLGFVTVFGSTEVNLISAATAAGTWSFSDIVNAELVAKLPVFTDSTASNYGQLPLVFELDDNRRLVVFMAFKTSSHYTVKGIVYDKSTNTAGSVTTLRDTSLTTALYPCFHVISSTSVLMVSNQGTAGQAVVLSISGTTITVNTAATFTLSASGQVRGTTMIDLSGSYIAAINTSTTTNLYAFTVSGTTVTVGSATNISTGTTTSLQVLTDNLTPYSVGGTGQPENIAVSLYKYSSTQGLFVATNSAFTILYAVPFTVSGTTITLGTNATLTASLAGGFAVANNEIPVQTGSVGSAVGFQFESGRVGTIYREAATNLRGAVISVSANVASISTVELATFSAGTFYKMAAGMNVAVWKNKALVILGIHAAITTTTGISRINVLSDVSGTATAASVLDVRTPLYYKNLANFPAFYGVLAVDENTENILMVGASFAESGVNSNSYMFILNCASNPTITAITAISPSAGYYAASSVLSNVFGAGSAATATTDTYATRGLISYKNKKTGNALLVLGSLTTGYCLRVNANYLDAKMAENVLPLSNANSNSANTYPYVLPFYKNGEIIVSKVLYGSTNVPVSTGYSNFTYQELEVA